MPLIYHVITDKEIGGAGLFLLHLLEYTDPACFPSLVLLPEDGALCPLFSRHHIPIFPIREVPEASLSFSLFSSVARLLRRHPCDLLHAHGAFSAKLAARLFTKAPILATRHCDTPFSAFSPSVALYRRLTDATVCPSLYGATRLAEAGVPQSALFSIPNGYLPQGVPTKEEKKAARRRLGIEEGALAVGLCGRLAKVKGHASLLAAARRVLDEDGRFLFLLLGEGPERQALQKAARELGIAERVRFLGYSHEVRPFYHALDIHLSASLSDETASLALAEGMSAGIPTLASDCPGNRERVGEGGLLFPPGDEGALAALLLSLRDAKARRRQGALALRRAALLPSFRDTAAAYASLYSRLLREKTQKRT